MSTGLSPYVDLYIDIQRQPGKLVPGNGGGQPEVLGFFQGSHIPLRIFPMRSTGKISTAAHAACAITGFGDVRVAVGDRAGSGSPLALAGAGSSYTATAVSTPDADGLSNYWQLELNLNTNELNTAIGTASERACFLEVSVSVGGSFRVVLQIPITIWASVYDQAGAISLPTASTEYYTKAELDALVVFWDNRAKAANAGKTILLTSPSGNTIRELGIANDGTPTDNVTV